MKVKCIYTLSIILFTSFLTGACGISSAVNQSTNESQISSVEIEKNDLDEIDGYINQVLVDGFLGELDTQLLVLPDAADASIIEGSLVYQSGYSLDEAHAFFQKAITTLGIDEDKVEMIDGEGSFQFVISGISGEKSLILQSENLDSSSVRVQLSIN